MGGKPKNKKEKETKTQPQQETQLANNFNSVFGELARTFDYMLSPFVPMKTWWTSTIKSPSLRAPFVDLVDKGDKYLIIANLPGYEKNDVEIQLNKNSLILSAEKKTEKEQKDQQCLQRERTYSTCKQVINFAEEIDPSNVDAKMDNSILEVVAPKQKLKTEKQMRRIELK